VWMIHHVQTKANHGKGCQEWQEAHNPDVSERTVHTQQEGQNEHGFARQA